ncbi:MAG: dUTP diphosphatase [Rhodospirillales bacterium]|nr:dUTP diphosphatase [Rhodospirillales bacterium]MBT4040117.1 dUTP diphosphatase [Rhodospirillales bacterium]MBT4625449.1 dUTP diphosphatase [Rhodospirillales bacterium]MBT5352087.1 dUTP diphosphatase [Rhodospirillales bacterium]MBT5521856.1 dUTP diphosphatase [Rhodospirillales bacterium]
MSALVQVPLARLPHGMDLPLPGYATDQSAGADLLAAVTEQVTLDPGKRAIVPTGISIALPSGYEAQVRPRSGLAAKHGVTVLNSPGTIDADYRGEVGVILINHGDEPFTIDRGMRIAQLIIAPVSVAQWQETDDLDESARGGGGFGSTGTHV